MAVEIVDVSEKELAALRQSEPAPIDAAVHRPAAAVQLDGSLWPILPVALQHVMRRVRYARDAIALTSDEYARIQAATGAKSQRQGKIAVLPISGVLTQRLDFLSWLMGGSSTQQIGQALDALVADETVEAILLDVDSPGGNYAGTPELAQKIKTACDQKRVWAIADSMAASAAYWLDSAADKFFCTPSGEVGSIGVLAIHYDWSAANEKLGVKPTYVTFGQYKAEFNSDSPLSPEATAELQKRVDEAGADFVKAVAEGRHTSQANVRDNFGQGRMFSAAEAARKGMIDGVDTIEGVLARMAGKKPINAGRKAAMERQRLALRQYDH